MDRDGRFETRSVNNGFDAGMMVKEYRPDLIVAVSCTDRLLKGLVKLTEVPCYVIPLELPHRMCVDTIFSVPHLMAAMGHLVEAREPQAAERILPLRREA